MKRNEKEMAEDRREEERESTKRRTTKAGLSADVDGERWDDGEVSFSLRPEEAAEAHDAEGLRERSHSGEKDASEARRRKENG